MEVREHSRGGLDACFENLHVLYCTDVLYRAVVVRRRRKPWSNLEFDSSRACLQAPVHVNNTRQNHEQRSFTSPAFFETGIIVQAARYIRSAVSEEL